MGVAAEIQEKCTPRANTNGIGWCTGPGGGRRRDGHRYRLGFVQAWAPGYIDPDHMAVSLCAVANLSQLRNEPILRARAEPYPEAPSSSNTTQFRSNARPDELDCTADLPQATGQLYQPRVMVRARRDVREIRRGSRPRESGRHRGWHGRLLQSASCPRLGHS